MADLINNDNFSFESFYNKVSESLECFICFNVIEKASACPKCLKFGCFNCFKKWIENGDSNCPFCRQKLSRNEIVKLTVLDEINSWLKNVNMKTADNNLCKLHGEKLSVMCTTCNLLICSQCGLFSESHKEHSFKPIGQIFESYKDKLRTKMKTLEDDIEQLTQVIDGLSETSVIAQDKYKSCIDEMLATFQQIVASSNAELQSKLASIDIHIKCVSETIQVKQNQLRVAELYFKSNNMVEFVTNFDQMSNEIESVMETSNGLLNLSSFSVAPINKIMPPYDVKIVKFQKFSDLKKRSQPVYSEFLEIIGSMWKLCIYPNGYDTGENEYLSVFIELFDSPSVSIEYDCCLEMVQQFCNNSSKNIIFQRSSHVQKGQRFGLGNFYQLKLLQSNGYLDRETDSLVFKVKIRPSNYYQNWLITDVRYADLEKKYNALLSNSQQQAS